MCAKEPKYTKVEFRTEDFKDPSMLASKILKSEVGSVSDGYHTFDELYFHRMMLFSVICNTYKDKAWKSKLHDDGTMYNNYFIVGITTPEGDYVSLPHEYWGHFEDTKELPRAPKWDGHKPGDVCRLRSLLTKDEVTQPQGQIDTECEPHDLYKKALRILINQGAERRNLCPHKHLNYSEASRVCPGMNQEKSDSYCPQCIESHILALVEDENT